MRTASIALVALIGLLAGDAAVVAADSGPVIVIPGRHGLPVIIDGVDVTGAVVEGDWGLYKPHITGITVIPRWIPGPRYYGGYSKGRHEPDGYYPAFGHEPGYGRHEIEPPANRRLPPPAQSYHRSFTTHSDPSPATLDPPAETQPLILSPQINLGGRNGYGNRPSLTRP